ncbi:hypothetical protein SeLEV6574_g07888 [Synchytrium endobioticum]|uniref:non-specific serine/threonine protein kinase n=1 Tax=Synchytrium endobioticum TaxID=286115 RepID=A0A507CHA2_9FUNG|nr:hypothetical protein SeLEV6574_g07888 [Synchytrium endobioticum]
MDAFGWTPEFNKDEQESPLRAIPSDGIIPSHDEPSPSQNTSEPSRPDQDPNQTPAKGVASVRHDNAIAIDHIREHAATKEPSSATSSQRVSFVGVRTSIFKSNRNRAEIVGITVKPLGPNAANDTGNGASSHAFPREEGTASIRRGDNSTQTPPKSTITSTPSLSTSIRRGVAEIEWFDRMNQAMRFDPITREPLLVNLRNVPQGSHSVSTSRDTVMWQNDMAASSRSLVSALFPLRSTDSLKGSTDFPSTNYLNGPSSPVPLRRKAGSSALSMSASTTLASGSNLNRWCSIGSMKHDAASSVASSRDTLGPSKSCSIGSMKRNTASSVASSRATLGRPTPDNSLKRTPRSLSIPSLRAAAGVSAPLVGSQSTMGRLPRPPKAEIEAFHFLHRPASKIKSIPYPLAAATAPSRRAPAAVFKEVHRALLILRGSQGCKAQVSFARTSGDYYLFSCSVRKRDADSEPDSLVEFEVEICKIWLLPSRYGVRVRRVSGPDGDFKFYKDILVGSLRT